jgi:hypothetical protein
VDALDGERGFGLGVGLPDLIQIEVSSGDSLDRERPEQQHQRIEEGL